MKYIFVLSYIIFSTGFVPGQRFIPLGGGFDYYALSLFGDSTTGLIFATGNVKSPYNNFSGSRGGITAWNGKRWGFPYNTCMQNSNPGMVRFRDTLLWSGGCLLEKPDSTTLIGTPYILLYYSNGNWIPFREGMDYMPDGKPIFDVLNVGDSLLYLSGAMDSLAGVKTWNVLKYDGTHFYGFPPPPTQGAWDVVAKMLLYNGELYVAGYFAMRNILKWGGTDWEELGQSIRGINVGVGDMIEHQGLLWVGGNFCSTFGDPGSQVATWDGEKWTDMGANLVCEYGGGVWDFEVFRGELYAVGGFLLGDGKITRAIKWTGGKWVHFADFDLDVVAMTQLNGELYFSGTFTEVEGVKAYHVVKYAPDLPPIDTAAPDTSGFLIYPNPTSSTLILKNTRIADIRFQLYNPLGQAIHPAAVTQAGRNTEISLPASLSQGVYYLYLERKGQVYHHRFVHTGGG